MKSKLSAAALAVAALCAAAPASAAIVLTFTPSATHINVGQTVSIDVGISGLGAEAVSALDVNFVYSAAVLSFSSVNFNGAEFGFFFPDPIGTSGGPGNLGYDMSSFETDADLMAIQTDNAFRLFTFQFTGAADGKTDFTLGAGANERLFVGLGGVNALPLSVDVGSVCIEVGTGSCSGTGGGGGGGTVPEPGTYGLVGAALLAAGFASRRRKQTAA